MKASFKIAIMTFCLYLSAFTGKTWAQNYDSVAVKVIQALITNNGLIADPDDPGSWDFAFWDEDNPKQLIELDFYSSEHFELTGAASFAGLTFLEYLDCDGNNLTQLDVSGLVNLQVLYCSENNLTQLNVSDLTNLMELACYENNLTQLDVSSLINLNNLDCEENSLTQLDISNCTNLSFLNCSWNNLSELNVSNCKDLMFLACNNNSLTALNIANCTDLMNLFCDGNQLNELDVSDLTNLMMLGCSYNNLTELDVSGLSLLSDLNCSENKLNQLNVSGLLNLQYLNCEENKLTNLDLTDLIALDNFLGDYQNISFALYGNGSGAYILPIELNNPVFSNSAISYNNGELISTSNTVSSSDFEVETGISGYKLYGTMLFSYSTDISNLLIAQMKVYPNPTSGQLQIESGELAIDNIEFFDITGKAVKTYYFNSPVNSSIDISELPNAVYFVTFNSGRQKTIQKIVKF
jgi:Leucine-rich repeat (LRR) protein